MKTEAIKATALDLSEGNILGLRLQGRLEKEDYDRILPMIENLIKEHGRLRLLLELKELRGITPAALWEGLKFDVRHVNDIERLAIVGEPGWKEWLATLSNPLVSGQTRFFEPAQLRAAWTWLKATGQ